jgi:2-desacetyl-2-hydroxyethyl bacteriochlorophyllide A dehydrogenase
MKAFVIKEPGKTAIVERERPTPGAGEVLLRVRCVGFCGSDLNTFRGLNPLVSYPRIPGHEVAASVVDAGTDVSTKFPLGQDVLVMPYTACGNCSACRAGRTNCCQFNQTLGVQREGAMTEFIVARAEKLLYSPKLSLAELALVEPLTIGFHAIDRGRVTRSDVVAVLGCGAIGLGAIAGAAARGAKVIAVDIDDTKLELAKQCGAAIGINSGHESLVEALQAHTNGDGPNVVVEAIGLPQTFQAAVSAVCFAGRVVYIGYAKAPVEYETKYFVMKELDILGSRNAIPRDFQDVMKLLESGKFPTKAVISHTTDLAGAGELLREWSERPSDFTKIQVRFD